jgi:hypothetical protein
MKRYAIFVDAGYFFAAGAQAAFNAITPRKQIFLKSPDTTRDDLCKAAAAVAGNLSLLRIYWYDAISGHLSLEQSTLAMLANVKLRLGALNNVGEQKGVDSLIVTDLIDLARNQAIDDAVVVSGDEDLRVAFQIAQSFGVRVHILAAGDASKNVSLALQMEADSVTALDANWFNAHFALAPAASDPVSNTTPVLKAAPGKPGTDTIDTAATEVIEEICQSITPDQLNLLAQHFSSHNIVPPEYDHQLIAKVSSRLSGRRFSGKEMRHIRGQFVRAVKARAPS